MTSITIRNLNDTLTQRLRIRAAGHGRSMEEEAHSILREAIGTNPPPRDLAEAIRKRIAPLGGVELDLPDRESFDDPVQFG